MKGKALLLPLAFFVCAAPQPAAAQSAFFRDSGSAIATPGQGWDVLRNERASTCIAWDTSETAPANISTFQVTAYSRAHAFASLLQPSWSDSQSTSLRRMTSDLLTTMGSRDGLLIVSASAVSSQTTLVGARLLPFAKALLAASPARFRDRCGDGAVRSIRTGGRYVAALRFRASATENGSTVAEALEAAAASVARGVSLADALQTATAQRFVHVTEIREGVPPARTCIDFRCMETTARGLLASLGGGGVLVQREVLPYSRIIDPRDGLPTPIAVDVPLQRVQTIALEIAAQTEQQTRLQLAEREPLLLPELSAAQRLQGLADAKGRLDALGGALSQCLLDPPRCVAP
jgi:hypothetical protein